MIYEGQICQAPMERATYSLPVMVGCSYGQCKFCNLFRHLKFRLISIEDIDAELKRVSDMGGSPKKIFLGDGNAFDLPTQHLMQIIERIHHYFPECYCINMDATVTGILRKTDEELSALYQNGVRHLYIGIETGLDDVLTLMKKDHNLEQAYEAIHRLQAAGLIYDAHIMTGVAGSGRGMENADALADFLNKTNPKHVVNFSMFIHTEVPLYEDIKTGAFTPSNELENLKEEKRLIQMMQPKEEIRYEGLHDYIEFRVRGNLPKDKEKMIAHLNNAIEKLSQKKKIFSIVSGECPHLEKVENHENVWCIHGEQKGSSVQT